MKRNLKPSEAQEFGHYVRTKCSPRARRDFARTLLSNGEKPRLIRRYLGLSGRQYRLATRRNGAEVPPILSR